MSFDVCAGHPAGRCASTCCTSVWISRSVMAFGYVLPPVPNPLRPLAAWVASVVEPPKVDWLRIVVPAMLYCVSTAYIGVPPMSAKYRLMSAWSAAGTAPLPGRELDGVQ